MRKKKIYFVKMCGVGKEIKIEVTISGASENKI